MKTERLKPDEQRPARANANAGRKKMKPMTAEEKQRQRNRLLETPDEVKEFAMRYVSNFITNTMKKWGYTLQNGPFSYDEMEGDAVKVIALKSYCAIYYGERRWPKGMDLHTVLSGIAWSKMDHTVKAYAFHKSHPVLSTDDEDMPRSVEKEVEEARGTFCMEMTMRDLGFEIAFNACRNKPLYLRYLRALQDAHSYEYMKDELGMKTVKQVMKLEEEVLAYLEKC